MEWIPFKEVDFTDESLKLFSIDTRDFHCLADTEQYDKDINLSTLVKYPERFFFTPEEVVNLLDRLFEESGGEKDWRMLYLTGEGEKYTSGWQLKYIRIHRTNYGLVVCNNQHYALKKEILNCKVAKPW